MDGTDDQIEVIDHKLGKWDMPIIEKDGTVVYPKVSGTK